MKEKILSVYEIHPEGWDGYLIKTTEVTANSLMWKLFMDLPVSVKSRFKLSV